jgi:hypothetical protein
MTNAQQLDLLLEMHAMLKDQKHEIKKLKKQHKLSKRMTTNLQHRIDSICNSLDNLSRRTIDSDLSSALSMISSKARSDDSGSLDDSKDGADFDPSPSRPSTIFFCKPIFRLLTVPIFLPPSNLAPANALPLLTPSLNIPLTPIKVGCHPERSMLAPLSASRRHSSFLPTTLFLHSMMTSVCQ